MSAVPKLRFPEFDGEWTANTLGQIGSVSMCKRIMKDQTSTKGDIPFFKIGTFGREPDAFISRKIFKEYKNRYSYPRKGEILISAAGTIGRLVVFDGAPAYFQDSNIVWLANSEDSVLNAFLYQFLLTVKWTTEDTTIARLYNDNLRSIHLLSPSLPEQQKIASFLSSVDKKIDLLRQKKDALELYKKGLVQKIFSQEIRFKQDDGSDFPDWEEVVLGDYSRFLLTNSLSRSDLDTDGVVQNIHYGDIHTRFSSQYDQHVETTPFVSDLEVAAKLHEKNQLKRGDIVIADASEDYADIGKTIEIIRISDTPLFAGLHTIVVRPDSNKFTVGFGSYLFQSTEVRRQIHRLAQGAKVLGLSKGNVQSLLLRLPCLDEQKKIAAFISAVDRRTNKLVHVIEHMETFKKGLLQQMFV